MRRLLLTLVVVLVSLQLLEAILGPPEWVEAWLRGDALRPLRPPRTIVVLGGGGMPSESTLLRLYAAAAYGAALTNTRFIVCLPADDSPETSSVGRMRDELVLRGVPPQAIALEHQGLNTVGQAAGVRELLGGEALSEPLLVVTSGYHARRSVLCFRSQGFTDVSALTARSVDAEADPGPLAWLRYGVWQNLARELGITRELTALLYYQLRGWI